MKKRIVVKLGTRVLTSSANHIDRRRIASLTRGVCQLKDKGHEVILVSSGAIATGMGMLGLKTRPKDLPKQQAAAAIGQARLMKIYDEFFKKGKRLTAQVLLTKDDLTNGKRRLNAKHTLLTLLKVRSVPIINENDTVAVDEIKFGDNDLLSAQVAKLVKADLLVILSDVDGFYKGRKLVRTIEQITPEIKRLAKGTTKDISLGGMISKVEAAKITTSAGIPCVIANGAKKDVLLRIVNGERLGTIFTTKKLGQTQFL